MDLLVVTRFPDCGPLPAVILARSSTCREFNQASRVDRVFCGAIGQALQYRYWLRCPVGGLVRRVSMFTGGTGAGVPHVYTVAGGLAESQHSMLVS